MEISEQALRALRSDPVMEQRWDDSNSPKLSFRDPDAKATLSAR